MGDLAVTHTTGANLDFARNWYRHLQRAGVRNYALLATDASAHRALLSELPGHVVRCPSWILADDRTPSPTERSSAGYKYRSAGWTRLMFAVPQMVHWVLQLRINVLWMDTDVVALADPFPFIRSELSSAGEGTSLLGSVDGRVDEARLTECERAYSDDRARWGNSAGGWKLCGGLFYLRHGAASRAFLRDWERRLRAPRSGGKNQPHYNAALRDSGVGVRVLPCAAFPNGYRYASEAWRRAHTTRPLLVHNNWIKGADAKRERFIQWGMWLDGANSTSTHLRLKAAPASPASSGARAQS